MKEIGHYMDKDELNLSYDEFNSNKRVVRFNFFKFDLEKFFKSKSDACGGILIVTPSQVIGSENLKDNYYGTMAGHDETAYSIYQAIYPDRDLDSFGFSINRWPKRIVSDGNILIYMLGGFCNRCMIYIPDVISISQYRFMEVFNKRIKNIYSKNKVYFDDMEIKFATIDFGECYNNLDTIIDGIKDRVSEVYSRDDENIIGYSFYDWEYDYSNIGVNNKKEKKKK